MKAKVSKKNQELFTPVFKTVLGGKQVNVSLDEFINNPRKYIGSGIAYLYENRAELKKYLEAQTKKEGAVVLDMSKASRGKAFDKKKAAKKGAMSKEVTEMLTEQVRLRERTAARFKKNQAAAKAKADAAAKAKADAAAKAKADAAAKAKADAAAKAKAAAKNK